MTKDLNFVENKEEVLENLEVLQEWLEACTDGGMHDIDDAVHNQILDLIDDTQIATRAAEIEEVIAQAKTIEVDLEAWLAQKGRTTLSLAWPRLNPSP